MTTPVAATAAAAVAAQAPAAVNTVTATARAFYALLALLSKRGEDEARRVWRELDPGDLRGSWERIGATDRLMAGVGTLQQAAIVQAESYMDRILRQQGIDPAPLGDLVYDALTGIASDGRDLDDLFYTPVIGTLADIAQGKPVDEAIRSGEESLATIVNTQISDTGRTATDIGMTVEPRVTMYVRMLVPPSCGRCAILAGRRYPAATAGFQRHPRCDCVAIPASEAVAGDLTTDPEAYFDSLSETDQNRYFTKAGAEAIRLGANIGQVVNARRGAAGLSRPGRLTADEQKLLRDGRSRGRLGKVDVYGRELAVTTEGTTRRGLAGKRLIAQHGSVRGTESRYRRSKVPRLMPEAIREIADGDRDAQIRMLRKFGFIV